MATLIDKLTQGDVLHKFPVCAAAASDARALGSHSFDFRRKGVQAALSATRLSRIVRQASVEQCGGLDFRWVRFASVCCFYRRAPIPLENKMLDPQVAQHQAMFERSKWMSVLGPDWVVGRWPALPQESERKTRPAPGGQDCKLFDYTELG